MDYQTISPILQQTIAEQSNDNTVGFMLVGSHARGDATARSDIDLTQFVKGPQPVYTDYQIHKGHLLSLLVMPLPDAADLFSQPQQAIYALPMWRNARILLDQTGEIKARQQYAHDFDWQRIQTAANSSASFALYRKAEEVITLLGAIERGDTWGAETHRAFLLTWLGTAVAMRYGILINSEKTLFPQTMEYLGHSTTWSQLAQETVETHPTQSAVAIHLYRETVHLLHEIIEPTHRRLIEFALETIEKAGF
jgi:predicted nucleotidyltransferase